MTFSSSFYKIYWSKIHIEFLSIVSHLISKELPHVLMECFTARIRDLKGQQFSRPRLMMEFVV